MTAHNQKSECNAINITKIKHARGGRAYWVVLQGKLPIGALDLGLRGALGQLKDVVEVLPTIKPEQSSGRKSRQVHKVSLSLIAQDGAPDRNMHPTQ